MTNSKTMARRWTISGLIVASPGLIPATLTILSLALQPLGSFCRRK